MFTYNDEQTTIGIEIMLFCWAEQLFLRFSQQKIRPSMEILPTKIR